jgi:hypothetical protein
LHDFPSLESDNSKLISQPMNNPAPRLIPPRIQPPAKPLRTFAFLGRFVPQSAGSGAAGGLRAGLVPQPLGAHAAPWDHQPALVKTVLLDERDKFQKLSQIRLLSPLLGRASSRARARSGSGSARPLRRCSASRTCSASCRPFVHATETLLAKVARGAGRHVPAVDRDMTRATFDVISATLLPSADSTVGQAVELRWACSRRRRLGPAVRHGRRAAMAAAARA